MTDSIPIASTAEDEFRPLKILIAGGGIGGLSAAIFLRQAGHNVEVLVMTLGFLGIY
jgi:monoamine oxidase